MPRRAQADLDTPPVRLVEAPVVPAELPPPPDHLSPAMQQWWRDVMRDYALDPHHLYLLEAAADAWDRMVQARETLAREGLTVMTKSGTKRHPYADIERDSRLAFARLVRELDLDCPPSQEQPGWRRSDPTGGDDRAIQAPSQQTNRHADHAADGSDF